MWPPIRSARSDSPRSVNHWFPASSISSSTERRRACRAASSRAALPRLRPRDALGAVLVAGQLLELAQLLDGAGGVERHAPTLTRTLRSVAGTDVAIVGGGAIGACCALELARRGARVTLYERGPSLASGCSAGNAGLICPSHSVADLQPGLAAERAALDVEARLARSTSARGRRCCPGSRGSRSPRGTGRTAPARSATLSVASLELHAQWGEELGTSFERTGTLNVYETGGGARRRRRAPPTPAVSATRCSTPSETRELEPALIGPVVGLGSLPGRGPRRPEAVRRGGRPRGGRGRRGDPHRRRGRARSTSCDAETVVVAAGAWSRELVRLPLEGGKGYHVDFALADGDPRIPAWIQETWTIATPLPDRLRLSGTLELAGLDLSISQRRVDTIRRGGDRWFRGLAGRPVLETWAGPAAVPARTGSPRSAGSAASSSRPATR